MGVTEGETIRGKEEAVGMAGGILRPYWQFTSIQVFSDKIQTTSGPGLRHLSTQNGPGPFPYWWTYTRF